MNSSMKLSTKLYIGFLVIPALILVGISTYSLYSFQRIDGKIQSIYNDRVIPLEKLKKISDDYAILIIDAVNKSHAGLISTQEALQLINRANQEIDANWRDYKGTNLTREEEELANEVERLFGRANTHIEEVKRALQTGSPQALDDFDGPLYESIDPVTDKIRKLTDLQLRIARVEREDAYGVYQETLWVFFCQF